MISYVFDNLSSIIVYAVLAIVAGAGFFAIGGIFIASIYDIKKMRNGDPNNDGVPATFFGGFVSGVIALILTIWQFTFLTIGVTVSHMLCLAVVAIIALFIIYRCYASDKYTLWQGIGDGVTLLLSIWLIAGTFSSEVLRVAVAIAVIAYIVFLRRYLAKKTPVADTQKKRVGEYPRNW